MKITKKKLLDLIKEEVKKLQEAPGEHPILDMKPSDSELSRLQELGTNIMTLARELGYSGEGSIDGAKPGSRGEMASMLAQLGARLTNNT